MVWNCIFKIHKAKASLAGRLYNPFHSLCEVLGLPIEGEKNVVFNHQ